MTTATQLCHMHGRCWGEIIWWKSYWKSCMWHRRTCIYYRCRCTAGTQMCVCVWGYNNTSKQWLIKKHPAEPTLSYRRHPRLVRVQRYSARSTALNILRVVFTPRKDSYIHFWSYLVSKHPWISLSVHTCIYLQIRYKSERGYRWIYPRAYK